MTTHELARELLAGPDVPACGYAGDESLCVAGSVERLTAGDCHDSLPAGTEYVQIYFALDPKHDRRDRR